MRKYLAILAILFSGLLYSQTPTGTTSAGKFKAYIPTKDNTATRVVVQDSITKEYRWILKSSLEGSTVTPSALTKTNDTNVTLTLGGTPATSLLQPVSLTLGWTGTLADSRITSASNWNTAYSNRITSLTTTGSSGNATLSSNILNIPNYTLSGLGYTMPTLQEILNNNHDLFDEQNYQGTGAGDSNTGTDVNAFGRDAGNSNTGNYVNAFGIEAASSNAGESVNVFGNLAGENNIGNDVNGFGNNAVMDNEGKNVNGLGVVAAKGNTADNVNAFGYYAGVDAVTFDMNTFKNVNLFGYSATADADNQNVFSKWISGTTKYLGRLSYNNITANRKWEFPDMSGDIALTSDIPTTATDLDALNRTGSNANSNINIGSYSFQADIISAGTSMSATVLSFSDSILTNGGYYSYPVEESGLYNSNSGEKVASFDYNLAKYYYGNGLLYVDNDGTHATNGFISNFSRALQLEVATNGDTKRAIISSTDIGIDTNFEMPEEGGKLATRTWVTDNSGLVIQGVDDTTTVALTSSDLNTNYPTATTGFKVYCTAITLGKMVYEKTPSGWIGTACIVP